MKKKEPDIYDAVAELRATQDKVVEWERKEEGWSLGKSKALRGEINSLREENTALREQLAQVTRERGVAVKFLSKQGYERCDGHCDSWHERLTSPRRESDL